MYTSFSRVYFACKSATLLVFYTHISAAIPAACTVWWKYLDLICTLCMYDSIWPQYRTSFECKKVRVCCFMWIVFFTKGMPNTTEPRFPADVSISDELLMNIQHFQRSSSPELPDTVTKLETADGCKVYLVGTAHFSEESQDDVEKASLPYMHTAFH